MSFEGLIVAGEASNFTVSQDNCVVIAGDTPVIVGAGPVEIDFVNCLTHIREKGLSSPKSFKALKADHI